MPTVTAPGVGAPQGLTALTRIRINQIVRMRVAGIREGKIAELLKITIPVLRFIVAKDEYKEAEEAYLLGHLSEMDMAIAGKVDALRNEIRFAVPAALRAMVDAVNQRRDLRTMLAAAGEILDRDPDRVATKKSVAGTDSNDSMPESLLAETIKQADVVTEQLASKKIQ